APGRSSRLTLAGWRSSRVCKMFARVGPTRAKRASTESVIGVSRAVRWRHVGGQGGDGLLGRGVALAAPQGPECLARWVVCHTVRGRSVGGAQPFVVLDDDA